MKKFFKENKNLVIGIFLLVIIFPFIILVPSPIGFIPYEVGLTLIGYGGSIIGGFLTLYGVWWTVRKQDEQRTEELRPIITIDTENRDLIELGNQVKVNIHLKNVGTYEASNIKISYEVEELWVLDHIYLYQMNQFLS